MADSIRPRPRLRRFYFLLSVAAVYFTLLRVVVWSLRIYDPRLMDALDFHHSDGVTWYVLWFLLPAIAALALGFGTSFRWMRSIGSFYLPLLLIGTLVGASVNRSYWGYAFKRPATFQELKSVKTLVSASEFSWPSLTSISLARDSVNASTENARVNPYYSRCQTGQLATEDQFHKHGWQVDERVLRSGQYLPKGELIAAIQRELIGSGVIITNVPEGYTERANDLYGQLIEFDTEHDVRFCYVCLTSGEVENDHYPVYEFLLDGDGRLFRNQRYFYDFAGVEGLEYATVAPPLELLLLLSVTTLCLLGSGVIRLLRMYRARRVDPA